METYFICCLILLTSFVEVLSDRTFAYRGETVLLFANVTAERPGNDLHVYINGVKDNTLIASWIFQNKQLTFYPRSYHNISMDENMNILMYKVNENYTGKYTLLNSSRSAIELIILERKVVHRGDSIVVFTNVTADRPDNDIQIHIIGVKHNTLIASWKFKNKRLTLDMKNYQNVVMDIEGNILMYNVNENYTGNYYIFNSSRPAIELIVHGSGQIKLEDPSQVNLLLIVIAALVFALLVFVSILYVVYTKCRKKKQASNKNTDKVHSGEDLPLVSDETRTNEDMDMNSPCPEGTIGKEEDEHHNATVEESSILLDIKQEETAETKERLTTVSDESRTNEDIDMNSPCLEGTIGKDEDEHHNATVEESSMLLDIKQEETAETKETLTTASSKKSGSEEEGMNTLRVQSGYEYLVAEMKEMKALLKSMHRVQKELELEKEQNKTLTETVQAFDSKSKALHAASMRGMIERMDLEEKKRKDQAQKANEAICKLENELRMKEEENRRLKDKMETLTSNRVMTDLESNVHQRNFMNLSLDRLVMRRHENIIPQYLNPFGCLLGSLSQRLLAINATLSEGILTTPARNSIPPEGISTPPERISTPPERNSTPPERNLTPSERDATPPESDSDLKECDKIDA